MTDEIDLSSSKASDMSESAANLIHEFLKYVVSHAERSERFRLSILYHIFGETRDGKTCMSLVVLDTKNVEITDPKLSLGL